MKFSITTTFAKDKSIEELIDLAKKLGLDAIEIASFHIDSYVKDHSIEELKKLLLESGLKCACISPYFDFLKNYEESIACAKKCSVYAKALDCSYVRTFLGGKASKDLSAREIKKLESAFCEMQKLGCFFALETHYNQPGDSAEFMLPYLKRFSNLKVLFDGFNYIETELDMLNEYNLLKDYVVHHHIKNYFWDKREPTSVLSGDVDFSKLIKAMPKDQYVSFEYFVKDPSKLIKDSIKEIKKALDGE